MGVFKQAGANVIVNKLITQLVLDDKEHAIKIKDAEGSYVNLNRVAKTLAIGIGSLGSSMAAVGAAAMLVTKQTANQGDKFDKLSQRIGISVEKLSAYEYVAGLSGTTTESMAKSARRLARNITAAAEGSDAAISMFDELNIKVKDSTGNVKDTNTVLIELADKFSKMPDGAQKTAKAFDILGMAGTEMIPMLNSGADGLTEMLEEGTKLQGWTTVQAKEAALLNDNMARITTTIKGIKEHIGKMLIPVFQAAVQITLDLYTENRNLIEGGLQKFPDVIKYQVIPGISTFMELLNRLTSSLALSQEAFEYWITGARYLGTGLVDVMAQVLDAFLGWIPGIGKVTEKFKNKMMASTDALIAKTHDHKQALIDILDKYEDNKIKIENLQEDLIINFDASHKRMTASVYEFNELRLDSFQTTNTKLDEEAQKRADEIVTTEEGLQDRLNQLNNDQFDYARIKLEEDYEAKRKNVEDKRLLDEWYDAEWTKIQDAEGAEELKRMQKRKANEEAVYREKHAFRINLQDKYADAIIAGGNLEQSITKITADTVIDTLQTGAKEKLKILMEAAVKVITGHVAEGLSMVGASSLSVWDAIPNVLAYATSIATQIAGAKAIAKNVNFAAGGGWLSSHPQGGVINQGSTGRADNVFLGSHGPNDFYGSRGESVFVMNEGATKRYLPMLSAMNISTGFAGGGLVGRATAGIGSHSRFSPAMSKDEQIAAAANNIAFGLMKHALVGWAMAGDWLHGIGPGGAAAGTNASVMIPSMFAGKLIGKKAAKKALGFGLGGFVKMFTDPVGYLEDKIGFGDIKDWIMAATRYIPGASAVGGALVSPDKLSMPKINLSDSLKKITRSNFIKSMLDLNLMFHNGGVITNSGMEPLGPGEVPFAGIGKVGEVLSPAGATGNNININISLNGIDRKNARAVVNDYIIPELNYYLTSRGGARI